MPHERGAHRRATPGWIGEVAAAIGHDVGNSLLAFSLLLSELRSELASDAQRSRLDDAEEALERASGAIALLGRLCALPNLDERLDLREVVAAAAPLLRAVAGGSFALAIPDAPVFVRAARASVERALFELALVAARSPEGADARLSLDPARAGEPRILLALASPAALDATALASARALADTCGGRLEVATDAREASRIELALPAAD